MVLYWILMIILIIGAVYSKKARFNAEKDYWKMKYSLDEAKQKEAQQQINHTRYGK